LKKALLLVSFGLLSLMGCGSEEIRPDESESIRSESTPSIGHNATDSVLAEAYAACSQRGEEAKNCAYHLWQAELMDLRPGSSNTDTHLAAVDDVFRRHYPSAAALNPQFEQRFWAWYWGAWWKEQPRDRIGRMEQCGLFSTEDAQKRCEEWAPRAWKWLIGRKGGLPE